VKRTEERKDLKLEKMLYRRMKGRNERADVCGYVVICVVPFK
jgi:hypothetical protein